MSRLRATVVWPTLCLALAGCDSLRLFGDYKAQESAGVEAAPYPRLVDVPQAPPPGRYTQAVPDPASGVAVQTELTAVAQQAERRRAAVAGPVIAPPDREALDRAIAAGQERRKR